MWSQGVIVTLWWFGWECVSHRIRRLNTFHSIGKPVRASLGDKAFLEEACHATPWGWVLRLLGCAIPQQHTTGLLSLLLTYGLRCEPLTLSFQLSLSYLTHNALLSPPLWTLNIIWNHKPNKPFPLLVILAVLFYHINGKVFLFHWLMIFYQYKLFYIQNICRYSCKIYGVIICGCSNTLNYVINRWQMYMYFLICLCK